MEHIPFIDKLVTKVKSTEREGTAPANSVTWFWDNKNLHAEKPRFRVFNFVSWLSAKPVRILTDEEIYAGEDPLGLPADLTEKTQYTFRLFLKCQTSNAERLIQKFCTGEFNEGKFWYKLESNVGYFFKATPRASSESAEAYLKKMAYNLMRQMENEFGLTLRMEILQREPEQAESQVQETPASSATSQAAEAPVVRVTEPEMIPFNELSPWEKLEIVTGRFDISLNGHRNLGLEMECILEPVEASIMGEPASRLGPENWRIWLIEETKQFFLRITDPVLIGDPFTERSRLALAYSLSEKSKIRGKKIVITSMIESKPFIPEQMTWDSPFRTLDPKALVSIRFLLIPELADPQKCKLSSEDDFESWAQEIVVRIFQHKLDSVPYAAFVFDQDWKEAAVGEVCAEFANSGIQCKLVPDLSVNDTVNCLEEGLKIESVRTLKNPFSEEKFTLQLQVTGKLERNNDQALREMIRPELAALLSAELDAITDNWIAEQDLEFLPAGFTSHSMLDLSGNEIVRRVNEYLEQCGLKGPRVFIFLRSPELRERLSRFTKGSHKVKISYFPGGDVKQAPFFAGVTFIIEGLAPNGWVKFWADKDRKDMETIDSIRTLIQSEVKSRLVSLPKEIHYSAQAGRWFIRENDLRDNLIRVVAECTGLKIKIINLDCGIDFEDYPQEVVNPVLVDKNQIESQRQMIEAIDRHIVACLEADGPLKLQEVRELLEFRKDLYETLREKISAIDSVLLREISVKSAQEIEGLFATYRDLQNSARWNPESNESYDTERMAGASVNEN